MNTDINDAIKYFNINQQTSTLHRLLLMRSDTLRCHSKLRPTHHHTPPNCDKINYFSFPPLYSQCLKSLILFDAYDLP